MCEKCDAEDEEEEDEFLEEEGMGDSVPIVELVGSALRGKEEGTCSNRKGCKEPIALVRANDNDKDWFFTDNNTDIVDGEEVVFGDSPEAMIAALEVYLGFTDPRLRFVRNHGWSDHHTNVTILDHPVFVFSDISDVAILIQLIDEYGHIEVVFDCHDDRITIRKALALGGYFISENSALARKDTKQAKAFLRRVKIKKKRTEETFWVQNLYEIAYTLQTYLPGFHRFKSRVVCHEIFTDIMGLVFMIEGIYGKGSRYRIEPFRRLIQKWRSTPKKSPAFEKPMVYNFVLWMDREAARPDNKKPLIAKIDFSDIVSLMANKNIRQGVRRDGQESK